MFIQLKQKEEILYGKRYETIYAEEFIKNKLITIFIVILIMKYQTFIKLMGIQIRKVTKHYMNVSNIMHLNLE